MNQTLNRRSFLQWASASAVASSWLASSCSSPVSAPEAVRTLITATNYAPSIPGILRMAFTVRPDSLDPALFTLIEAYPYGFAVFDGLVRIDHTLTAQPMLAESWQQSSDGLVWTFQLRKGVTFHHGALFDAEDVVYSITRLLDPALRSILQPSLSFIDTISAVDAHTVRFHLKSPNVELPILLGAPQALIIPRNYNTMLMSKHPSGTGPFLFSEFLPESHLFMTRNPSYWDKSRLHLEEVQHYYIVDFDEQVAALQRGEVDLLPEIGLAHIPALRNDSTIKILETPSGRYQNLAMRVSDPPFDDLRVRQALKHCADASLLRQLVLQEHGEIGHNHPVASLSPYWSEVTSQVRDIEKARALLAEAGYKQGLKLDLVTAAIAPGMVELAKAFQEMAKPAGIEISVIEAKLTADIYLEEYWGRVPFYVSLSDFRPSIYETFAFSFHSKGLWNVETGWSSQELDSLLAAASGEMDEEKRKALYQKAQQLIMEEGAVIIPYFQPVIMAARNTVQGVYPHPSGWLDLLDVQVVRG